MVFDPGSPAKTPRPAPGFLVWRDVIEAGEGVSRDDLDRRSRSLDCNDPINIQYTSGTTGFPKAVELTHRNILNNAWYGARAMHFTERDRLCVAVPFYHCFGMVVSNLLCLSVGACIVIPCEHFDALKVLQSVATERCTAIHGVPTMFVAELEHPAFDSFDLTSLRTGIMAGAPCPPELMRRVIRDMHCSEILLGYGQTEASPLTHLTSRDDSMELRVETVGTNLPHQEVKVVAVDGEEPLPLGEVGEVCFRGYHI
ncbi:MAG: AMP-binding protein, partial [Sedimenticola sp.]